MIPTQIPKFSQDSKSDKHFSVVLFIIVAGVFQLIFGWLLLLSTYCDARVEKICVFVGISLLFIFFMEIFLAPGVVVAFLLKKHFGKLHKFLRFLYFIIAVYCFGVVLFTQVYDI